MSWERRHRDLKDTNEKGVWLENWLNIPNSEMFKDNVDKRLECTYVRERVVDSGEWESRIESPEHGNKFLLCWEQNTYETAIYFVSTSCEKQRCNHMWCQEYDELSNSTISLHAGIKTIWYEWIRWLQSHTTPSSHRTRYIGILFQIGLPRLQ